MLSKSSEPNAGSPLAATAKWSLVPEQPDNQLLPAHSALPSLGLKNAFAGHGRHPEELCLSCGLCCNGVIFADVKLSPGEQAAALLSLGMPLLRAKATKSVPSARRWRFLQPCSAFDGCRCRIYAVRPNHCRHFECLLLKKYLIGSITKSSARRMIGSARRFAQKIDRLLRALADNDGEVALAQRVARTAKRLEDSQVDEKTAVIFSQLTLAFHRLCQQLEERFYPAPAAASASRDSSFASRSKSA